MYISSPVSAAGSAPVSTSPSELIQPTVSEGQSPSLSLDNETGVIIALPTGFSWFKILSKNNDVYLRLGDGTLATNEILTTNDVSIVHGAITKVSDGTPTVFTPGNYLRGVTSGARAYILEAVSTLETRVAMVTGSVQFVVENMIETATGYPAGDLDAQANAATNSLLVTIDSMVEKDVQTVIYNPDISTYSHLAVRTGTGTASIVLTPIK